MDTNRIHALLGIELPIIQAPMAGVQAGALAVAVSNAGGLGSLPCALLGRESIEVELAQIGAQTSRPYNVNFFCHSEPPREPEREEAWRRVLAPYFQELGIEAEGIPSSPARAPSRANSP